jgi:hypothetical protein
LVCAWRLASISRHKYGFHETISKTNGRIEIQHYWAIVDPLALNYIRHYEGWMDLQTIVRVQREQGLRAAASRLSFDVQRLLKFALQP